MAILFTEGFGIYGTGDIAAKLLDKWDSRVGTGAWTVVTGRHSGGINNAIRGATGGDSLTKNLSGIAAGATVTLGFAMMGNGLEDNNSLFRFQNSAGENIVELFQQTASPARIMVRIGSGLAALFTADVAPANDVWAYFELIINTASGGNIELRKDGTVVGSAAHGLGAVTIASLLFRWSTGYADVKYFQDIYVSDNAGAAPQNAPLGDVRIETLLPNAVGANNQWPTFVHPNKLTVNQASLETDLTGWEVLQNCTLARSTTYAAHGVASLEMTATASQPYCNTTPGTGGFPVVAGKTYSGRGSIRVGPNLARQCAVGIRWFDSVGAYLSITAGAYSQLTQSFAPRTVTAAAPTNAAIACLALLVDIAGSGDTFYGDEFAFGEGTSTIFNLPSSNHFEGVRETPQDADASYIASDTVGHKDSFGHTDLATASGIVFDVRPTLTFSRQAVGTRTVGVVARVGTTDYDSAATVTPEDTVGAYKTKQVAFPTNPATSAAWTVAAVNAAEFGPKIVS